VIISERGIWMAIEYSVSQNGSRIETFPKGQLSVEETIDYFNRLANDNKIIQGATEIVYFKYVTDFKFSYSEAFKISNSYQKPKTIKKIGATIFVCETDHAYAIGKMMQTYHRITNPEHKVVVVSLEGEIEKAINEL
jgi:hypothetical protein